MKHLFIVLLAVMMLTTSCESKSGRKATADAKEKVFDTTSMETAVLYEVEFLVTDSLEEHYFMYGINEYDVQQQVELKAGLFPTYLSYKVSIVKPLNKPFKYIPAKKF